MASKEKGTIADLQALLDAVETKREALARAKCAVNGAECDLANAINAFGKVVVPDRATPGEGFCVLVDQGATKEARRIVVRQRRTPSGILGDYEVDDWRPAAKAPAEPRFPAIATEEGKAS